MKKVSILSLHLGFGGIEKSITNLANLMSDEYEIEIISTYKLDDKPAFKLSDKVKVTYLIDEYKPNRAEWKASIKKFRPISFIKETYKSIAVLVLKRKRTIEAIKNCDSDIIISTRDIFNKWLGEYGKNKAYKIAWEHNHHHQDEIYAKKIASSVRNIDSLVLVSDSLRSFYKKEIKKRGYKCKSIYIPNMLDYVPDKTSKLTEKRLVCVGRLSREKGHADLIEVFKEIHKKREDWKLDIIGDGSEKNKVVDLVYQYGLKNYVKVHGYLRRDELNDIINKSSIYMMTSFTESFGLVLIEAMSHGLPVVAFSSAEGANDLIENGKNGYLIEDRDVGKMANTVISLIDDTSKRLELGKNGREFSQNFASSKIKKEWVNLLKRKK